jgi:MATE family multidrug resistance protein
MAHSEHRRARLLREMRVSFVLALPLALGQLAAMLMSVVDSLLAGRHGLRTLAAVTVGSSIWNVALFACVGLMLALPPSISQLNGAGRRDEIAPLWRQAAWIALALGVVLTALVWWSPMLLGPIGIVPEVRAQATEFLQAIAWGAPALALYFCFRYLSEGLAWTPPSMVAGIAGLLVLAPLGYALMFGAGPMPELGAAGLGYATAFVLWLQAAGFLLYLRRDRRFADLQLFARFERPHWPTIRGLLVLGLPMGVSIFMEGSLFVATALLIGRIGAVDVAAHQIALNVASVCFMLPLGIAMATTVRVGYAVGAEDRSAARYAGGRGLRARCTDARPPRPRCWCSAGRGSRASTRVTPRSPGWRSADALRGGVPAPGRRAGAVRRRAARPQGHARADVHHHLRVLGRGPAAGRLVRPASRRGGRPGWWVGVDPRPDGAAVLLALGLRGQLQARALGTLNAPCRRPSAASPARGVTGVAPA